MGRYEWIILEVGFVLLLLWELRNVRRDIRRAKEAPPKDTPREKPAPK